MSWKLAGILSVTIASFIVGCSDSSSGANESSPPTVIVVAPNTGSADDAGSVGDASTVSNNGSTDEAASSTDGGAATSSDGGISSGTTSDGGVSGGTTTDSSASGGTTSEGTTSEAGTSEGAVSGGTTSAGAVSGGTTTDAGVTTDGTTTGSGSTDTGELDSGNFGSGSVDSGGPSTDSSYVPGTLTAVIDNLEIADLALAALEEAGLDLALNSISNDWTVFLPSDEATEAAPSIDLLSHFHVVSSLDAATLSSFNGSSLNMNTGVNLTVSGGGDMPLSIGGARVLVADLMGNTGPTIVHIIDTVISEDAARLYPEGSLADLLQSNGTVGKALAALRAEGLDLALDNPDFEWTVFLPHDDAIDAATDFNPISHIYTDAALGAAQLTGLSGTPIDFSDNTTAEVTGSGPDSLLIGAALLVDTDIEGNASSTIVHIIDAVLN